MRKEVRCKLLFPFLTACVKLDISSVFELTNFSAEKLLLLSPPLFFSFKMAAHAMKN